MRDENSKKSKLSWSKNLVRKWFNIKSKSQDFHADDVVQRETGGGEWRTSFLEREAVTVKKSKTERFSKNNSDRNWQANLDFEEAQTTNTQDYRLFVATWNVGGKSPPSHLNLEDWLHTSPPADIYILGFQEIVPLNAGNVLGAEDNAPAKKWVSLIRKTLSNLPAAHTLSPVPHPIADIDDDFEGSSSQRQRNSHIFHRHSFQSLSRSLRIDGDAMAPPQPYLDRRFSVCERAFIASRPSDFDPNYRWGCSSDDDNVGAESPSTVFSPISGYEDRRANKRYCLVASKQMVGIFLTVWVRNEIRDDVKNLKVSCVGRGLMGYLGNKGSISISMTLHQTTFCFVCSHLTSGQKEGDELRRNSDVMEILRKTRFPQASNGQQGNEKFPETILEHDRVIWLGDLNYRIALSYRSTKALVEMHNWKVLLEKDQLRMEQRSGRVFAGWHEGTIYFPPTYKYLNNSDRYAGEEMHPKEKRRTPAWCDRVLWHGGGLHQLAYVRGESKFSDHRPVYSLFDATVKLSHSRLGRNASLASSRVEVEELLPYSHVYTEYSFY